MSDNTENRIATHQIIHVLNTFVKLSTVVSGLLVDSNVSINCKSLHNIDSIGLSIKATPYCIMEVF